VAHTRLASGDIACGTVARSRRQWLRATAGADGRFRFHVAEAGRFQVFAEGFRGTDAEAARVRSAHWDGVGTALSTVIEIAPDAPGPAPLVLRLRGPATLSARVTYTCGAPVDGLEVSIAADAMLQPSDDEIGRERQWGELPHLHPAAGSLRARLITDADGRFVASGLADKRFRVHPFTRHTTPASLHALGDAALDPGVGEARIVVDRPHVHVRVVDADGALVDALRVRDAFEPSRDASPELLDLPELTNALHVAGTPLTNAELAHFAPLRRRDVVPGAVSVDVGPDRRCLLTLRAPGVAAVERVVELPADVEHVELTLTLERAAPR